jgi:hypothetical protein
MRDNDDDDRTVASFDLLVPGMGELIGGSQREERHETLLKKLQRANLRPEDYAWYLDTRRSGSLSLPCPPLSHRRRPQVRNHPSRRLWVGVRATRVSGDLSREHQRRHSLPQVPGQCGPLSGADSRLLLVVNEVI